MRYAGDTACRFPSRRYVTRGCERVGLSSTDRARWPCKWPKRTWRNAASFPCPGDCTASSINCFADSSVPKESQSWSTCERDARATERHAEGIGGYSYGFLDAVSKREIRRSLLKGIAISIVQPPSKRPVRTFQTGFQSVFDPPSSTTE